jgi:SNF2 family DNA or RNA helicase
MLKPFVHQAATTAFLLKNPRALVTSDPGTGKTRSVIDAFAKRKDGRMLVLAPLSILGASWADDIKRFQPDLTSVIAYARNREAAFRSGADIVIANHDAAKWIAKHEFLLDGFSTICIDEFTAFKNKDSQRSKAALRIMSKFANRIAMSGTPNSNTILDIWHPMLLIDDGERLGRRFYGFRSSVCTPRFNGFANEWADKPNAQDIVAAAIKDVNVRYKLEECIDMPEQSVHTMLVDLTPKIMDQYNILAEDSVLYTGKATINAINAGARVKKLLQLCTGAVYTEDGKAEGIHEERYELVMQLVAEREHSLVAFNWRHEREHLVKLASELGFEYDVIDGETPASKRKDIVDRMQAGQLKVVFAHPQSAGHGLTLTKATSVIWSSPTYNAEQYQQFNRRIYRAGQTQKTQIIHIAARDTWEPNVYEKLQGKLERMDELLETLTSLTANRT